MKYNPHPYQQVANQHIIDHLNCGLFLEMGLGKTVATLTAIDQLMFDRMEVNKVLVIAPKRVAEDTWIDEVQKWDHLRHLKLSIVLGSERKRKEALMQKADIYVINRENVAWLVAHYGTAFPFDMVVIDELSSFKSAKASRFKALRQVRPKVKRVVGLTGTPRPNGLLDLWPQLYLLDQGERLGKTLTGYREKYFNPGKRNGHVIYEYKLKKDDSGILGPDVYEREIYEKISDICISMKARDYLDLPDRLDTFTMIHFSPEVKKLYDQFERDQVLQMGSADEITALSAAALYGKLLQFSNGAIYDANKDYHEIHHAKIEALEERIEAADGQPVLVLYQFKHDLDRIMRYLKKYKPVFLQSGEDVKAWNRKEIQLLVGHPASMGHGLNMQAGGHILEWFGLPSSLELRQQTIARLDRQGQTMPVLNNSLAMKGSIEETVIERLSDKAIGQEIMMDAVKAIVAKYR